MCLKYVKTLIAMGSTSSGPVVENRHQELHQYRAGGGFDYDVTCRSEPWVLQMHRLANQFREQRHAICALDTPLFIAFEGGRDVGF